MRLIQSNDVLCYGIMVVHVSFVCLSPLDNENYVRLSSRVIFQLDTHKRKISASKTEDNVYTKNCEQKRKS